MYSSDELFQRSRECYFWCLFPELRSNEGNKHQLTLEWAQKQFITRAHTLFYFLHDITNP